MTFGVVYDKYVYSNMLNKPQFMDIPLILPKPKWDSKLASIIVELEKLRVKKLGGPVPPHIFFQLKTIFQMLESVGSARIEGNRTTLAEFVEKVIEQTPKETTDQKLREIFNIERAITFIETQIVDGTVLTRAHISEIHKILVDGLAPPPQGEGSRTPGAFRTVPVRIQKSTHIPPEPVVIPHQIEQLLQFSNQQVEAKNDLLVTALAHHRLAWIHPFDNGNGRMVRMFTYALLIKQGFKIKSGRILNPSAIFCMDRQQYYDMLERGDTGEEAGFIDWCTYVLDGLRREIEKIDRLLNLKYMTEVILLPALDFALERENITKREYDILRTLSQSKAMQIKSADLNKIIGQESPVQRSRIIRRLKDKRMLVPFQENGRIYTIGFSNTYLLRGVIGIMEKNDFIPASFNGKK